MDDPPSPYFLHLSDGPDLVLVFQPLTGENYASRSHSMVIALSMKNKLGFIDRSVKKLEETDVDLLNCWCRNNNMVFLLTSCMK